MATRQIGSWNNGSVIAEVDYNVSNELTAVRVINTSGQSVRLEAEQESNKRSYAHTFAPGTIEIAIPTTAGGRVVQFLNGQGKWDGLNFRMQVPAP